MIMESVLLNEAATPGTAVYSFFGYMGVSIALTIASKFFLTYPFWADLGAAYGTAKSGVGISTMGVLKPDIIVKNLVPVIMAGILGIYGLIISVILL
jgi:V-type H+-transporting ATPase proteolipid subunit